MSTPRGSQKKTPGTSSTAKNQKSILGFFKKASDTTQIPARPALDKASIASKLAKSEATPVPSSDPAEPPSSAPTSHKPADRNKENGLSTPITQATVGADTGPDFEDSDGSPVRKVSYFSHHERHDTDCGLL